MQIANKAIQNHSYTYRKLSHYDAANDNILVSRGIFDDARNAIIITISAAARNKTTDFETKIGRFFAKRTLS